MKGAIWHLVLPTTECVQISLRKREDRYYYRGESVEDSGDPLYDAITLVNKGHREGDTYIDTTAHSIQWCKVLQTGEEGKSVVFGIDVLWGGPLINSYNIDSDDTLGVLGLWLGKDPNEVNLHSEDLPTLVSISKSHYIIEADTTGSVRFVSLRSLNV